MIGTVPLFVSAIAGILGAVIGSFLTVVIHRVPAGLSIVRPRSRCPECDSMIRARDNVPVVSYLVRGGRCATCRTRISPRYPIIELTTATLFVAAVQWAWHTDRVALVPAALYLASIGVALTVIDLDVHRLPNAIVLPSYPVLAVLLGVAALVDGDGAALLRAVIGAAALFALYATLALIHPRGMGWGDVKLAGLLGGFLGYISWSAVVVGGFGAFLLGALVAIVVMARRRGTRRTALPFGPFMFASALIGTAFGDAIAEGYLGLIAL